MLIRAIRNGKNADVKEMIAATPDLINACASAPPKKDDGQSPLQIAFKSGRFEIADFLIERGANVAFIETSDVNEWRAPVIHDAIRAAAFNMRVAHKGNAGTFETAIALLTKLLDHGADANAIDSYGNSCLGRALLDLKIQLTSIPLKNAPETENHDAFNEDASQLLGVLLQYGADSHAASDNRKSAFEQTRGTYFERFL